MKKRDILTLFICILVVILVAYLGSIFTSTGVESQWYKENKPSLTPPDYVFPIAWTILFLMIAVSLFFSWKATSKKNMAMKRKEIIVLFSINFILNIFWSLFYFGLFDPTIAFIDIIFLELSIISLIIVLWRVDKKASWLLVPYALWVGFASVLNYLSI